MHVKVFQQNKHFVEKVWPEKVALLFCVSHAQCKKSKIA